MNVKIISPYNLELAKDGDAGYDLRNNGSSQIIKPGQSAIFDTGVFIEMPRGLFACAKGRSGLWFKAGISIGQDGTIDSGYRNQIRVRLVNLSQNDYVVSEGERIAQLVFQTYIEPIFIEVDKLSSSDRGKGGFGHTGK